MFYGARGRAEAVSSTAGGTAFSNVIASNSEVTYTTNYESYIEQLTYQETDVLRTNEGVFVRFQHNTAGINVNYTAKYENNRPTWTRYNDMPSLTGYVFSVGVSQNQQRIKDTFFKAAENAIIQMIQHISVTVNARDVSLTRNSSSSSIHNVSEGNVSNFQILEIWVEPDSRYVYVLAIARAAQ
jgi:hypothetical protein